MSKPEPKPDTVISSVQFTAKVNLGGERTDWWSDQRKDALSQWRPQASPMGMEFHRVVDDKPTGEIDTVPWPQVLVWRRAPRLPAASEAAA